MATETPDIMDLVGILEENVCWRSAMKGSRRVDMERLRAKDLMAIQESESKPQLVHPNRIDPQTRTPKF